MLRYTFIAFLVIIIKSIKFVLHTAIISNCALNLLEKKKLF